VDSIPSIEEIPRGNTCRGVNRFIIECLPTLTRGRADVSLLDLPCGRGEFVDAVRRFFPHATVRGGDVRPPVGRPDLAEVDLRRPFTLFAPAKFDVITSISGVMEFDNTLQFLETCRRHLKDDGWLVVSNDNIATVRDRWSFLFLGKVRRFNLLVGPDDPTWKLVPIQNLVRILHEAGFAVVTIRYLSVKPKDWVWTPVAALLWPLQWIYLRSRRSSLPVTMRRAMFPFRSLLMRHYVVLCRRA
jgi:2-polyprenyl-3-methyl-5-hydroxy-6-metoxy-1,4-benzoquinol methylase